MPGLILQPTKFVDVKGPLVYLAGPILGTRDWRSEAIPYLHERDPHVHIANPKAQRFSGDYAAQMDWCERYAEKAATEGALLFWMSEENHRRDNRAYAQEARFELGQYLARSWSEGIKIVIGFERGFTGGYYLRDKIKRHFNHVPICRNLRQACAGAIELATSRSLKWAELRERLI